MIKVFNRIAALSIFLMTIPSWAESFVYKVEKQGKEAYLAGTIHMLGKEDYPLPKEFDQAYQASSKLAFEVDLDKQQTPEFQQATMHYLLLKKGTLQDLIDAETWQQLMNYAERNGMTATQFSPMKPGMASIMVSMNEITKLGVDVEGVDAYYFALAKKDKKPYLGLESVEEQLAFLGNMGSDDPSKLIQQTLDEAGEVAEVFPKIKNAWRKGDIKTMDKLMIQEMKKDYPSVYRSLLVERNNNWMPKIEAMLADEKVEFILVGAAHLVGEDGLIQLLEQRGYSVKQL